MESILEKIKQKEIFKIRLCPSDKYLIITKSFHSRIELTKPEALRMLEEIKELSNKICGFEYEDLIQLFGMRHTIELLHQKLKLEGFNV